MRVLFVLHRSPWGVPGGTELHTLDLLANLGSQVKKFLFYPEGGRVWLREAVSGIVESAAYEQPTSRFIGEHRGVERFFAAVLKTHRIDLVHFQHMLNLPTSLGAIAVASRVPYVVTLHDYFFWCVNYNLLRDLQFCWFETDLMACRRCLASQGVYADEAAIAGHRWRMRALLQSADAIFCASDFVKRSLQHLYPDLSPSRITVIELGSPPAGVKNATPRLPGPLRVAFVGAFTPAKGSHYFSQLVQALAARGDVTFFAVGVAPLGPDDYPALHSKVHWLGQYAREELHRVLGDWAIDVALILSPWAETFSYTLSEVVLAGIPVIATDLGALRERVSKHGVGFLVEAENPVPRLTRILEDLAAHPEALEPFKRRCLAAATSLLDPASMTNRYLEVYQRIVAQTRAHEHPREV
jgi:glycosyltransferase involved in cell wall biosynthesis